MAKCPTVLAALGGEAGCKRLSTQFYARVGQDAVLKPLFPGKTLKCAVEEFSAFLVQFLGGNEEATQRRWWLSLRESHARFRIGREERCAWLKHMDATLEATPLDDRMRTQLRQFFEHSSGYVAGNEVSRKERLKDDQLAACWDEQLLLDHAIACLETGRDKEVIGFAPSFRSRPAVFVGLLARMVKTGRAGLITFVVRALEQDASLANHPSAGRTLLHYAAAAGCLELVVRLLGRGMDPNVRDHGGHTALYAVANECPSEAGPRVVRALVAAGADVNACGGITRATALHMAARRGHIDIARALLDCGAATDARDSKGATALQRAVNCRKRSVAQLLAERGST